MNTTRNESYWAKRNSLVDAVDAARGDWTSIVPAGVTVPDAPVEYSAALDALALFDADNDGAPVL